MEKGELGERAEVFETPSASLLSGQSSERNRGGGMVKCVKSMLVPHAI